jgi:acetyl-CoA carboxylase, biotin carboxylase subunit
MAIRSVLIANRGEIAVRVIRSCKQLGVRTVQVYSDADVDSLAVQRADKAVNIGASPAAKSYLDQKKIIDVALIEGVDAIHPGYGFLAENPDFAEAVVSAGLIFIGPNANTIRVLGNKVSARELVQTIGVPTAPGSDAILKSAEEAIECADEIGYPLMLKASAGGGGRGIRIINNLLDLRAMYPQASAEAKAAFGDGSLYLEKFIAKARHIEVQILGDGDRCVHLGERDCSIQRRRQKLWEEAPSLIPRTVKDSLCEQAVRICETVSYKGAGTVEFLYDALSEKYYFLEVNTRIQVEHPVSEMVTGIDIVKEMILICGGDSLAYEQSDISTRGHAIECRINAEDPSKGFLPWPGVIESLVIPKGDGVRFDSMLYEGCVVPPFYDSLLGKLIVWAPTREECLYSLEKALNALRLDGIPTTTPLHQQLVKDPKVLSGNFHIGFLEEWLLTQYRSS